MKVLQLLNLMTDYQPVAITPDCNLDWNDDNPYVLEPQMVRDLRWFFVRKVGEREVTEIQANGQNKDDITLPYLTITYK